MDHDMPGHDMPGTGTNDEMMEHGMIPYLFTSTTGYHILFKEAMVMSTGGFVGAMIAVFVFSILSGAMTSWLHTLVYQARKEEAMTWTFYGAVCKWFILFFHYTEMLLVMSFNVWIILAVLFGHSFGWIISHIVGRYFKGFAASQNLDKNKQVLEGTEDDKDSFP